MTEEQEQARLAELRKMAAEDIGSVSLLTYETAARSKINFARDNARLRQQNAELLEACRIARELCDMTGHEGIRRILDTAINKAEMNRETIRSGTLSPE